MATIKKEIIFGLLGLVVVIGAVVWFAGQYKQSTTMGSTQAQQSVTPATSDKTTQSVAQPSTTVLSVAEVAKHNSPSDCWFIVSNKVYNVTSFINSHPGGAMRITSNCGKDATQAYQTQGGKGSHSSKATAMLGSFFIGDLNAEVKSPSTVTQPASGSQQAPQSYDDSEKNEDE